LTEDAQVYPRWVEGFSFTLTQLPGSSEEVYAVSQGKNIEGQTEITIPETYNGKTVAVIAANAFSNCNSLVTINIPNTVQLISSASPFGGCTSLEAVNITSVAGNRKIRYWSSNGVVYDLGAIDEQNGKSSILFVPLAMEGVYTIPDGVETIPVGAFEGSSISGVVIPASVTTIEVAAFESCNNLTSVTFATSNSTANELTIKAKAFAFCPLLSEITLPARLKSIAVTKYSLSGDTVNLNGSDVDDAFLNYYDSGLNILANINVESGNKYYSSENGILFNADKSQLLYVPYRNRFGGTSAYSDNYTIPSSVKTIANGAFAGVAFLQSIKLPSTVTSIGDCAFYGTKKLNTVTFGGDAVLTSTTIGKYAFRNNTNLRTVTFEEGSNVKTIGVGAFMGDTSSSFKSITIPGSVSTIGANAFKGCTSLATITFAENNNTTFTIENGAFDDCASLTSIYLPANVSSLPGFSGCTNLSSVTIDPANPNFKTEADIIYNPTMTVLYYCANNKGDVTIPATVTEIAGGAFVNNTAITSIIIPATVTKIGGSAFSGCTNLATITFEDRTAGLEIGEYAFMGTAITSITLPEQVTSLGAYAFANTKSLTSANIPTALTAVADYLFYKSGITSIAISNNVVSIGEYAFASSAIATVTFGAESQLVTIGEQAFASTSSLERIELPASLKSIGGAAFGESALTTVTFATNSQLETIGEQAFAYTTQLTEIVIPKTVKTIGDYAFDFYYSSSSLATVTFEAGGTEDLTIGAYAFRSCTKITSLALPARTKIIDAYAFSRCSYITSVTFADNDEASRLQTIGEGAFYNCSALTSITIPKTVGNYTYTLEDGSKAAFVGIGSYAFRYNYKLESVNFEMGGSVPLSFGEYAFGSCSKLESVTFPARLSSATALTSNLFAGYYSSDVPAIKTITIQSYDGAPACDYVAIDNIVYDSAKTQMIISPAKNEATIHIPNTITAIPDNAFYGSSIAGVVFEHGENDALTIGDYAFYGCTKITSVVLPDSVTGVGTSAFANCTNLESVTLSKSFVTFDISTFTGCTKLAEINVAAGNANYSSVDGVLLNANGTKILYYAAAKTATEYAIPGTVTEIAESVFSGNAYLEKVTIPASVTLINDLAFYNCSKLKTVEFATNRTENLVIGTATSASDIYNPSSSYNDYGSNVFAYCTALETIVLPEKTTSLGSGVFYNCTSLISASLPSTLKTMGMDTFYGCSKLATVTFADNCAITSIPERTFYNCSALTTIRIPAAVEKISASSSYKRPFAYAGITSVTFEANSKLTEIGDYAFNSLSSLLSIDIPTTVTKIGEQAFDGCSSLASITLPNSVKSAGFKAFNGCSKATSLTIGSGLTEIGSMAFYNLGGLNAITVDPANTYFKSSGNCLISNSGELLLGSNTSVIPQDTTVTSIADNAFYGCSELTTLLLPNSLQTIGTQVFDGCKNLTYTESGNAKYLGSSDNAYLVLISATSTSITSCEINANTKIIYSKAFNNCSALGSIVIPANIISISDNAFYGCSNLLEVQNLSNLTINKGETANGYVAYYALSVYGANEQSSITTDANGFKYVVDGDSATLLAYTGTATTLELPDKLGGKAYSIYAGIFAGNTTLVSVTIPEGVTAIPANAFNGCTSLTTVSLPSTLTAIGDSAFYGCTKLTSITIPEKVKTLGSSAFYGCTGLTEINLNATINDLSSYNNVFYNAGISASGITLNIGANVTKIANYLFDPSGTSYYFPKITSVIFASGSKCTEIGNNAFYQLNGVTSLVLPEGLQKIGDNAFYYLTGVTSIVFPDSLTTFGYEAIDTSSNLEYIVIGKNVTSIGSYVFYSVSKLKTVYFHGTADELSASIVSTYGYLKSKTQLYYSETEASGAWRYVDGVPTAW
jgi:hypothetical protein